MAKRGNVQKQVRGDSATNFPQYLNDDIDKAHGRE